MKRWLFAIMLVILPMEVAWSAAAAYCGHEPGAAARHFGHHEHKHSASPHDASGKSQRGAAAPDPDCGVHKHGSEILLLHPPQMTMVGGASLPAEVPPLRCPSFAPQRPERPNWRPLA